MNFKEGLNKTWNNIKAFIDKGFIQKFSRVSYDVVWNIILFFVIITVIGSFFVGGVGAGYFASLIKDEPLRTEESMVDAIYNYSETSEIYFANNVYMGEVSSDLHREEVELADVSEYLTQAIIATEDEYFETHNGIVPKAIMRAMFQELTNATVQSGGSTLTQQIIKNQILTNEVSFERKAKEILLALRLEHFLDKDEILEAYLNIVPFGRNANGRNIAGIQTAANGIFGVDASELNIAQSAYIAGLPQSPIAYTPFTNFGVVKSEEGLEPGLNRMRTVLSRMLGAGYITQADYDEALDYDIVENLTDRSPSTYEQYPYLAEEIRSRTIKILKEVLAVQDGYTLEEIESNQNIDEQYEILAKRAMSQDGYKIHTTIDKDITDAFLELTANFENYGPDKTARNEDTGNTIMTEDPETGEAIPLVAPVQVGSVLTDNATGAIISFVGGRDFDIDQNNYSTTNRQIGSTAKPLLVYGPAMEEGLIQPGSIIADVPFEYDDGINESWTPTNFTSSRYYGLVTARTALTNSYNVTASRTYVEMLEAHNPVKTYFEPMGFNISNPGEYEYRSMALGTHAATVEENTNAYATFGNNGEFIDGYMIERIENIDGDIIYQHEVEPVRVFSPETSYLMVDMMRDVLTSGTARTARANLTNPSVDWAGKTGTSNDFKDTWFVATNPNVTVGTWMGYAYNQTLNDGYSARSQAFWAQLVNVATDINPDLMAPSQRFQRPNNIVSQSYSMTSGLLPSDITRELGLVGTDIYNSAHLPKDKDNSLIEGRYVIMDGEAVVAGDKTPSEFTQSDGISFDPSWLREMGYDQLDDISQLFPSSNPAWTSIATPNTKEVENDGRAPRTPVSLTKSGNVLAWSRSTSNDVVGYRIYRANDPDSTFELLYSTVENNVDINSGDGVYRVSAVDYFGQESNRSDTLIVGDFSADEPTEDEEDNPPDGNNEDAGDQPNNPDENDRDRDGEEDEEDD